MSHKVFQSMREAITANCAVDEHITVAGRNYIVLNGGLKVVNYVEPAPIQAPEQFARSGGTSGVMNRNTRVMTRING